MDKEKTGITEKRICSFYEGKEYELVCVEVNDPVEHDCVGCAFKKSPDGCLQNSRAGYKKEECGNNEGFHSRNIWKLKEEEPTPEVTKRERALKEANNLYSLQLHEDYITPFGICILKVPGGWIYDYLNFETGSPQRGTFVPFPEVK